MSFPVRLASHFSLRLRLTILAGGTAAIVLTIGALLLYDGLRSAVADAVTAELRVRADDVAAELTAGSVPTMGAGLVTQILTADGDVVAPAGAAPVTDVRLGAGDESRVVDGPVAGIGGRARVYVRTVRLPSGEQRFVAVAGSAAPIDRAQDRLEVVLGIAGPMMVLVVAAMAWRLTGAALRPVSRMTSGAATLSLRDPDARLPLPPGRDEIAQLGRTLNSMLDRIADTVRHERAFVDDASHELRTPLAVLRSELELARMELDDHHDPTKVAAALDSALEETDRLARLAERLLVLARADAGHLVGEREAIATADLLQVVLERVPARGVTVDVDVDPAAAVLVGDRHALEQLLVNLLTNAVRWANKTVLVTATAEGRDRVIRVADDGPGFAEPVLARAFDRFSRADSARGRDGGTGLGLAIVAAIAQEHGGEATAINGPPLGGAVVEVRLPPR